MSFAEEKFAPRLLNDSICCVFGLGKECVLQSVRLQCGTLQIS